MASVSGIWVVNVFYKGGLIMYPILMCSVLVMAIFLERIYTLKRRRIINPKLFQQVRKFWLKGEIENAIHACQKCNTSIARILKAGLLKSRYGLLEVERAIEGAGAHEVTILNSNLKGLGVIANLAPMLGLLGTVTGMIKAFDVISESGTGNPGLVAGGISEALITTATGLIVAIPTLAIYHYLKGRVNKLIFEMEETLIDFMEELSIKGGYTSRRPGNVSASSET